MADKGKSFDIANAPRDVTYPSDPTGALNRAPYPKHLFKFVSAVKDDAGKLVAPDGAVIIAWDGKAPICNEYVEVADAAAEAEQVEKGYAIAPVLKAPKK